MVKKLLYNRISKTVGLDAMGKIRQAAKLIREATGELTAISEEDYKALRKISDKLKQEADDVYAVAQEHLDLVQAPLSFTEITKDKSYYEFGDAAFAILEPALNELKREQNIAGSEYLNGCAVFEGSVAVQVGYGNAQAQNAQLQLNKINRKKGGGSVSKSKKST